MITGLLWFNNSKTTPLEVKVQEAYAYYVNKFNREPNLCLVNPAGMEGNWAKNIQEINGKKITIRTYKAVLPGHLWIGIEEDK